MQICRHQKAFRGKHKKYSVAISSVSALTLTGVQSTNPFQLFSKSTKFAGKPTIGGLGISRGGGVNKGRQVNMRVPLECRPLTKQGPF